MDTTIPNDQRGAELGLYSREIDEVELSRRAAEMCRLLAPADLDRVAVYVLDSDRLPPDRGDHATRPPSACRAEPVCPDGRP